MSQTNIEKFLDPFTEALSILGKNIDIDSISGPIDDCSFNWYMVAGDDKWCTTARDRRKLFMLSVSKRMLDPGKMEPDLIAIYELERVRESPTAVGATLIAAERQRQITVEGWTPEHDDGHTGAQLALAAATYVLFGGVSTDCPPLMWPWSSSWWKGQDRLKSLVKAGALIAAEIDRLQRAKE